MRVWRNSQSCAPFASRPPCSPAGTGWCCLSSRQNLFSSSCQKRASARCWTCRCLDQAGPAQGLDGRSPLGTGWRRRGTPPAPGVARVRCALRLGKRQGWAGRTWAPQRGVNTSPEPMSRSRSPWSGCKNMIQQCLRSAGLRAALELVAVQLSRVPQEYLIGEASKPGR